jgi:hypothetical protein
MTLEQLKQRNEKFQQEAATLAELMPGGNMLEFSSLLIRGSKKVDAHLAKLVGAKNENQFHDGMSNMEDELDEMVYMLDKLDQANRGKKVEFILDFLKLGYDLVSLYSMCCDQLIAKKLKTEEF